MASVMMEKLTLAYALFIIFSPVLGFFVMVAVLGPIGYFNSLILSFSSKDHWEREKARSIAEICTLFLIMAIIPILGYCLLNDILGFKLLSVLSEDYKSMTLWSYILRLGLLSGLVFISASGILGFLFSGTTLYWKEN